MKLYSTLSTLLVTGVAFVAAIPTGTSTNSTSSELVASSTPSAAAEFSDTASVIADEVALADGAFCLKWSFNL